ncbi:MAG: DNA repair protein RadA [Bacteroidota bacterium]|nr:DNA repair protein RadA [Bacteroidota bacterium]
MAKTKTIYVCQNCGTKSVKWQGKCSGCGEWNTFVEEVIQDSKTIEQVATASKKLNISNLENFDSVNVQRIQLPDKEFNRVVGGGIVPGSLILLGGEPGIGKSTLLLQLAVMLQDKKVLYVSGEESVGQIKIRAKRINIKNKNCLLVAETKLETIAQAIENENPSIIIIDSIQTLTTNVIDNTAGSVTQIRECTARLSDIAKVKNIPIFLVGHITKEGYIAGPKILEHMVDTVLYFEGDRNYDYRILRTIKNRFGSISDIGIYEMNEKGLREVKNPSEVLLSQRDIDLSGISIAATIEGIRPMLIEIQALVAPTYYGTPQRTTTGFDSKRMSMLLAVLEKRCDLKMNSQDVFLNIAGGIKVKDPSIDLSAVIAIASSFNDFPIKDNVCFVGEVGLSGEIRPVKQLEKRITEAEKLGFDKIYVSSYNKNINSKNSSIEIIAMDTVAKLIKHLF